MEGRDNLKPLGQLSHGLEDFMGPLAENTYHSKTHYMEDYF